ncbi:hypothetical protein QFZ34_002963 [Phyllobacterium ifriqiyense]|uniref:DUF998 domain-containing protein n=1 Tax=Phyllobacterium ifriqiyense TaxID=314238 RepID=A0ABU0SAU2_9HYPH|nr:hypothetical protein [Phyllobacterium ifriqiyense]MDQ0997781.1 hypothetical protein [Phyllobacterium ifriqiyense]
MQLPLGLGASLSYKVRDMEQAKFTTGFALLLLAALVINIGYFAFSIDPLDVSVSLDESGAIETFQLAYIAGATALFFIAGLLQHKAGRMFSIGMAVLCIVFFLRELEVDRVGPITTYMNSKVFRIHEAVIIIAVACVYLAFRWRTVGEIARFVFSKSAWPFYVAAIFLLIGAYCDSQHGTVSMQIKEEIAESASYLALMVTAAGLCYQHSRHSEHKNGINALIISIFMLVLVGAYAHGLYVLT